MKAKPDSLLIASDHAGFALKQALQKQLPGAGWKDLGPAGTDRVDYPDFARLLSEQVAAAGPTARGILICGSGIGMCMAANKVDGVRAALADNPVAARLSREHNDANVLCLGARFVAPEYAAEIVQAWIDTPFSNDPRHMARVEKIRELEKHRKS